MEWQFGLYHLVSIILGERMVSWRGQTSFYFVLIYTFLSTILKMLSFSIASAIASFVSLSLYLYDPISFAKRVNL
jgi:hypothetical protein